MGATLLETPQTVKSLARICDAIGVGLAIWRLEDENDDASLTLEAITEVGVQHIGRAFPVGRTIDDLSPASRQHGVPKRIADVIRSGEADDFGEIPGATSDSFFRVKVVALDRRRAASVFENITDRRRLERLHEMQSQMLAAVEEAVIVVDLDGNIVSWNAFAERIYGWKAADVVGDNMLRRAPEAVRRPIKQTLDYVKRGKTWSGVYNAMRIDGTEFPARTICAPIRQGGVITGMIAVSVDESGRVESDQRARVAEEHRRALISAVPDLIFRIRRDGTYLEFAGNTSDLVVPPHEFLGRRLDEILPQPTATDVLHAVQKALASGGTETLEYQLEIKGVEKSYIARIVASGADEVVVVSRESTEEIRNRTLLREAYEKLEKRVEERTADLERATDILLEQIIERKRAEGALQQSHDRLQLIVNSSPAAMVELDRNGIVLSWNSAAERIFGWRADEVIGKPDPTVHTDAGADLLGLVSAVSRGALFYELPVARMTKSGSQITVNLSAAPLRDKGGEVTAVLTTATAASSERKVDAEIETLRQKLASLSAVTAAVSSSLDMNEILSAFRGEAQRTLRADAGGLFIKALDDSLAFHSGWGVDPENLSSVTKAVKSPFDSSIRVLTSTDADLKDGWQCVAIVPVASRQRHWGFLVVADRLTDAFEREQLEFLRTIAREVAVALENASLFTEVSSANDRLRLLSRSLVAVQEGERRHLGRELHDQIGQTLTGLKFLLESSRGASAALATERLGRAEELVQRLFEEVRTLSLELRPPMLDDAGLVPALVSLIDRFRSQTSLDVRFHHGVVRRLDTETEIAAFRIVQEALTNAARHGRCKSVAVRLWTADAALLIQIDDDGVGFDVAAISSSGAGLSSMRERAMLVGGRLGIESTKSGTTVSVELPMAREVGADDVVRRDR